jgi:hypothetical protein
MSQEGEHTSGSDPHGLLPRIKQGPDRTTGQALVDAGGAGVPRRRRRRYSEIPPRSGVVATEAMLQATRNDAASFTCVLGVLVYHYIRKFCIGANL